MRRVVSSRRAFLKAASLLSGATVLAACGATTAATATPGTGAGETAAPTAVGGEPTAAATAAGTPPATGGSGITLRYRSWHTPEASPGDAEWYDWLRENYPAEHQGTQVEFEFVPFGAEYIQKVLADSAAGTPPDLLHSSIIWARDFFDRGVLLVLNDYIDPVPELGPDNFLGASTDAYRSKEGQYYGVPWEGPDSGVIGINSTLFAEAGLDPQGADIQTWEDLVNAANAIVRKSGNEIEVAGFLVDSFRYIETYASWLYSNGGAMHNEALTEPTFNNEAGAEVLQLGLDLLNSVSFPISPERQDIQIFMQGQTGMAYAGTWSTTNFDTQAPEGFEYWLIPYPQGPSGSRPAVTTWSNMFTIPGRTPNPDAAFELMRFCTTPPAVITRFELSTRTTPLKAIFESEAWDEQVQQHPALVVKPQVAELGGVYPFFPFYTEANDAIGTEFEQVMLGQKSIEEGLSQAEQNVRDVIARRQPA